MSAEALPDTGPCQQLGCKDGQWSHKRGRGGCREVGCGCDKYLPPPVDVALPCGTESARRRHLAHGEECAVCDPSLAQVEAEPEPVYEPEAASVPVVADPAAQAEHAAQLAAIDAQLDQAEPAEVPGRVEVPATDLTETMRELGRERTAHRDTQATLDRVRKTARERAELMVRADARIAELEATVARMVDHFDAARAGDPARVLYQYDADHCTACGFRTTVPGMRHRHPMTPVTVLVVERTTAEADAEATNPTKE